MILFLSQTSSKRRFPCLPDLFLPDERGGLVNAFAGRIDGHGHRHVLHLELVDRFHAQVFKSQHLCALDRARDQIGSTTHRHQIGGLVRSEEHTSELQSLMRISYAVFCLKKKKKNNQIRRMTTTLHSK